MTQLMVVGFSLGSALSAATASVLQHRSAHQVPPERAPGLRLLRHLVTARVWLAGLVAAAVGLGFHAAALAGGQLAVVQPLLVCGLLFALPLSIVLEGRRPSLRESGWAFVLVAALAVFLLVAHPSHGAVSTDADSMAWTAIAGSALMILIVVAASRWQHHRAPFLACAAGLGYGVAAALLKQTTAIAAGGLHRVVIDWPLYALVPVGAAALGLTQLAYRAGPLADSLPALTIADPASSVLIGVLAFHEGLAHSPLAVSVEAATFVVMGVASAHLAH